MRRLEHSSWVSAVLGRRPPGRPARDRTWQRVVEVSEELRREDAQRDAPLSARDIEADLGIPWHGERLLLGRFERARVARVLERFGFFDRVRRLGYVDPRVRVDALPLLGDRVRLHGDADGSEHLLGEAIVQQVALARARVLFVHWLTLRNPRAHADAARSHHPGQDVPGAGLARQGGQALALLAIRAGLDGIAFNPAHYHVALIARRYFRFLSPARQGRFEALMRDLAALRLAAATRAIEAGAVVANGVPYAWEPDPMVLWLRRVPADEGAITRERERVRFAVAAR
jgi:hypothetical protein